MSESRFSWLNDFPDLKLTQFNYPIKNKHLEECLNSTCWTDSVKYKNQLHQSSDNVRCPERIILLHNHPSGNVKPSSADIEMTKKLKKGGELLEIKVLDHVILGKEGFYSTYEREVDLISYCTLVKTISHFILTFLSRLIQKKLVTLFRN